jgi:Mce-associated membrane protein
VAVPPAPDEDPGVTSSNPHDRPQSPARRLALLGVLVVALLASAGVLIWLLSDRTGEADDLQSQRETVMAQTEQFMLRMGTFGPDMLDDQNEMPEYRKQVKEVITPKFETSFDKQVVAAEQLVAQGQVSRKAEVFATGVSVMDEDSATALVAGSFTDSFPQGKSGKAVAGEPVPFRMEVDLVKTGGKWLVDDFTPITGDEPQ